MSLKYTFFLFVLLTGFIYLFGIGSYGLISLDEPRYAGCALEMIENNDFIVPKFNCQDRFDKPVFFYWLIVLSYKLFGVSSFSSRFPSALCAILLIVFTWYSVSKIFGRKVGFLSALVLATSVEFIILGRRAATDMALTLFFSSAMYAMYLSYHVKNIKEKILWMILSGIFAGVSLLIKGPIGLIFQLLILTLFLVFRKQIDIKHIKIYFLIVFISLLVSFPWYFQVHNATNGEFTKTFFLTHNFQRFTDVVGEHPGPFWFYVPVIIGGFMPWTFFLIPVLIRFFTKLKKYIQNKFILYLLIWSLVIFLFFSFSKTKLETYILLLFPSISILTAYWINLVGKRKIYLLKNIFIGIFMLLLPTIGYAVFLIYESNLPQVDKVILVQCIIFNFLFLTIAFLLSFIFTKKYYSFIFSSVVSFIIPAILILNTYLPIYYKYDYSDLEKYAKLANKSGAKEIIAYGTYKPILVYYGRVPVDFGKKKSAEQIKKIRLKLLNNETVFIIGANSDISQKKKLIQKNKDLFDRLKIIESSRKYFLGKFE